MLISKKYQRFVLAAIILNLVWAGSALVYDWPAMTRIPVYWWPFVVICPYYPFLLALVWRQIYCEHKLNRFLLAFAAAPSVIYFLAALMYYPTWMIKNNFDWLAIGQIFWVAFYGLQGWFLLKSQSVSPSAVGLACVFLLLSFAIQYRYDTFGYLDTTNLSRPLILAEYSLLGLATVFLFLIIGTRRKRR